MLRPETPTPIRRSIEVSPDELQEMAFRSGREIDLPDGRGWAYLTTPNGIYRAWLAAPGDSERAGVAS